jgi:GTPase SAR1 family protein
MNSEVSKATSPKLVQNSLVTTQMKVLVLGDLASGKTSLMLANWLSGLERTYATCKCTTLFTNKK